MPDGLLIISLLCPMFALMSGEKHIDDPIQTGIAAEMEILHQLEGEVYWKKLKAITERKEFKLVEKGIFSAAGNTDPDYIRLLDAARKATELSFQVFILPNPKGFKSADMILVRKGFYRMYDVKTITGERSISSRLDASISQSDRVLLSINVKVNPRFLADSIRHYFENNDKGKEVLLFKGGKSIVITRAEALSKSFQVRFRKTYTQ